MITVNLSSDGQNAHFEYVECDLLIDPEDINPEQIVPAQDGMWEALERDQAQGHLSWPCSDAEEDWNAVIERRNREYDDLHPIRIVKR